MNTERFKKVFQIKPQSKPQSTLQAKLETKRETKPQTRRGASLQTNLPPIKVQINLRTKAVIFLGMKATAKRLSINTDFSVLVVSISVNRDVMKIFQS